MPYKDKDKQREYQRIYRQEKRDRFLVGLVCIQCGSSSNLEVDHIDPLQKTDHRIWTWSDSRITEELSKCQILCITCHHIKHRKPERHGHSRYVYYGCRCDLCKKGHAETNRKYKGI